MKRKEKRAFAVSNFEVRKDGDSLRLSGHAAVFDSLSEEMWGFREIIRKGAFTKTIQGDDIRALFNHNPDHVLGRNISKTLRLSEDDKGLHTEIDLPDTQFGRDLAESVRRGDISQMSFGFRTMADRWFKEDGEDRRELLEVKLFDVSPVTFPAYPETDVSAGRSAFDPDELIAAINRVERAGVEARGSDLAFIEDAYTLLGRIKGKTQRESGEPVEARIARLQRELKLLSIS